MTFRSVTGAFALRLALSVTVARADTGHADLWWNASESGWGAHVTQQADVIFLVLFVYDSGTRPTIEYAGSFIVARSGDTVTIDLGFHPGFADFGTCRMIGRWNQEGSLAAITHGTYACTFENGPTPVAGTFEVTAIESGESGFAGRYTAREDGTCLHSGRLGGFRARVSTTEFPPPPPPPPPDED